jgi:excinuclease ABC subunit A
MSQNVIRVVGAREHNLKNITVEIPRDKLVVITGLSGSGKSSLAFDTIFAEGQRRYVESLSAYARQFLGQMDKPDVDTIEGLSPAVSIDQKGVSHNPRSTVGTVTEVYDYLRLLFARTGIPTALYAGEKSLPVGSGDCDPVEGPHNTRLHILAPVVRGRKGVHQSVIDEIQKSGFVRVRVDGQIYELDQEINLDRYKTHTIEAVVDRLVMRHPSEPEEAQNFRSRLTDSIETALKFGDGYLILQDVSDPKDPRDLYFSEHLACPVHGISLPEIEPRTFSFNTPHGACPIARVWAANSRLTQTCSSRTQNYRSTKGPSPYRNGAGHARKGDTTGRCWKQLLASSTSTWTSQLVRFRRKNWTSSCMARMAVKSLSTITTKTGGRPPFVLHSKE